ncbi:MAG: glycosyltransferase [Candidatus Electrothrix scaldis]|nr:MAG: glycosyltransferase [Candidatus Electrothrix sp. GW3-3]
MLKILGLSLYGPLAASTRYRLEQYIPGLSECGIDLQVHHLLGDEYLRSRFQGKKIPLATVIQAGCKRLSHIFRRHQFDAYIVHCELFPLIPGWLERLLLVKPYIYDFDDAFYLKYRIGNLRALRPLLGNKFNTVIAGAAAVTAGNRGLNTYAQQINTNSHVLPTVVDVQRYHNVKKSEGAAFTVGWIGSPSTSKYLPELVRPLSVLGSEGPVRLIVVGGIAPKIENIEVIQVEWEEEKEIAYINSFDVGLMPLADDEWARGKCAFKLIQYMACGVPVIASRVGANIDVVQSDNGVLVRTEDEWIKALRKMRNQPLMRQQMGRAGRRRIEDKYSLQRNVPLLAGIINNVIDRQMHGA